MFGLGFLNSLFLFGLGAMALPIIIHILNRRRLRKVSFSSLEFIFELSQRRMSKVNLRRWIVLLLRTLAVMLIALAFARPTIQNTAALFMSGEAPKHVVICLDASSSMGAEREIGTAFTRAQELASRIVDESGKNDLINIIACSSQSEVLFDAGTRNKQIVKNVIQRLDVTAESTSLPKAIEVATSLIERESLSSGEIYVVSDFCEGADSLLVSEMPHGVRVMLVPVSREAVDNVSIDRVFTPRKLIRPGEVIRIGVAMTNHSRVNAASISLELFVDGRRKAEKVVTVSPASSLTETFPISINNWGTYRCRIAKNRDRLPVDDDRYFLLDVSQKIPVTLIRGRKFAGEERQAASYFYVEKALNPRGSGEGEFSVETVDERNVTASNLPAHGVVVWTEPEHLDEGRFELLKRYVRGGGAVLLFLGHDRQGFWHDDDFARYVGIDKATVKEQPGGERFASFEHGHAIFSIFNEEELELLALSRIRTYLSVSGVSPDSVLAYLGSGDPGIWECRRGKGRLLVMAAAPDMPSGDLPLSPMFLPLLHTSVTYLASATGGDVRRENLAGNDLVFDLPRRWRTGGASFQVVSDAGETGKPILYDSAQGDVRVMLARPRALGFYRLVDDTTTVAQAAVNVDVQESDLNPHPLDRDFTGDARLIDTGTGFVANLQQEKQGREVYAMFLLLAVSALVGEAILGRKA